MRIVPRIGWGFTGWRSLPLIVPSSERTHMMVHYQGDATNGRVGSVVPRVIHSGHLARGWKGIGYNFVIDLDGNIFEGRGVSLDGAHCTNWNRKAYGVQCHIGGTEKPSPQMLAALQDLHAYLSRHVGRQLVVNGHRDGMATACPGEALYAHVRAWSDIPKPPAAPTPPVAPAPSFAIIGDEMKLAHTVDTNEWFLVTANGAHKIVTEEELNIVKRILSAKPLDEINSREAQLWNTVTSR